MELLFMSFFFFFFFFLFFPSLRILEGEETSCGRKDDVAEGGA